VVGQGPPPAVFSIFVVSGSAVTFGMLAYILVGGLHMAAAYITALTIDFSTVGSPSFWRSILLCNSRQIIAPEIEV
jgi:hypothetical protein